MASIQHSIETIQEIHGRTREIGTADVVPPDVVKLMLIDVLFPTAGQSAEPDFVTPFTVAVSVMVAPCWQPLIAPKVLP
jgi:hypothetical protein